MIFDSAIILVVLVEERKLILSVNVKDKNDNITLNLKIKKLSIHKRFDIWWKENDVSRVVTVKRVNEVIFKLIRRLVIKLR